MTREIQHRGAGTIHYSNGDYILLLSCQDGTTYVASLEDIEEGVNSVVSLQVINLR